MDYVGGEELRSFLLHYNFSSLQRGRSQIAAQSRSEEIGHGALARKPGALCFRQPDSFPIRSGLFQILSSTVRLHGNSLRWNPLTCGWWCAGEGHCRGHCHGAAQGRRLRLSFCPTFWETRIMPVIWISKSAARKKPRYRHADGH